MKRIILTLVAVLALTTASIKACGYGGPRVRPLSNFVNTDHIVMGRVLGWEGRTRKIALQPKATQKQEMLIAVVKVEEAIKQDVALTHLRVAVLPAQVSTLATNRPIAFFLNRHFKEPVFVMLRTLGRWTLANKPKPEKGWTKIQQDEMKTYRKLGKLAQNVEQSLTTGSLQDRLLTSALVLTEATVSERYLREGRGKRTVMDPDISRQVLLNLADAQWGKPIPGLTAMFGANPESLFWSLRPSKENGWTTRKFKSQQEYWKAAREWCHQNADTFRIKMVARL